MQNLLSGNLPHFTSGGSVHLVVKSVFLHLLFQNLFTDV